jgi:diacylglycerol kinase family enzyme
VKNINKLKVIRKLPLLFNGKFTHLKEVNIFDCNKITIESDPAFYVQIDGESKGEAPIEIEAFQSKIAIIIP